MLKVFRNLLAVLVGIAIGGSLNMALITAGSSLIPPPAGVDVGNAESLALAMPLFEPRHFLMPFLAHAVGTFVGAVLAYWIAASHKTRFALAIGLVFLCGGIAASFMIPAPGWFIALDVLLAYLPTAWLGARLGAYLSGSRGETATAH